ncbi:MAG: nucleotidyltransferase domain-containing protein [Thermoanaerobaculia bacterium]
MDAYAEDLLSNRPEVEEVVVFGSFAEGNWAPGSDIDVFVRLSRSDRSVRDRIPELLPESFPVGVDLFPYTDGEIEERGGSPVLEAVRCSAWRYVRRR